MRLLNVDGGVWTGREREREGWGWGKGGGDHERFRQEEARGGWVRRQTQFGAVVVVIIC